MKILDTLKQHKKLTIVVSVILIALFVWDISDPPLFWQVFAIQNKTAIMEYVEEKYPGAKVIGYDFESTELFHTSLGQDSIDFEYNGVEFCVYGMNGKIHGDTYARSKAEKYIDENYLIPFFEQKGVSPQYTQYVPISEGENLAHYEGVYTLLILQKDMPDRFVPGQSDWFYDFYLYWLENCELDRYSITLRYILASNSGYSINFKKDSPYYNTSEEFYAAFRRD